MIKLDHIRSNSIKFLRIGSNGPYLIELDHIGNRSYWIKFDHILSNGITFDQIGSESINYPRKKPLFHEQCFDDFFYDFFSSNLHRGSRRHHRNNHHSSSTGSSASNMGGNVSSKFSKFKFIFKIRENLELVFCEIIWLTA